MKNANKHTSWILTAKEILHFKVLDQEKKAKNLPHVLWGWKRDKIINKKRYPESRTVYFSADLILKSKSELQIDRAFFFLDSRAKEAEILKLKDQIGQNRNLNGFSMQICLRKDPIHPGYAGLQLTIGASSEYDKETIHRRIKGKPRAFIPQPKLVQPSENYDLSKFAPFSLYAGSGLSAECGLPLLGSIHNLFEVDDDQTGELVFGDQDNVPSRLMKNIQKEFNSFCQITVDAIKCQPSLSYKTLADWHKKGIIKQVLTDNIDGIFNKVNVPYTQTRLSIFPDHFPAKFDPKAKSLLVIGVAVDRRNIIKQARKQGLKIIVINPVLGVAPHSRNMDYMRPHDLFFKEEACVALPKIIKESKFL